MISVRLDGEAVGVCGVLHGSHYQAFAELTEKLRKYPPAIWRAGAALKKLMASYDGPIYASPEAGIAKAENFLLRLGFEFDSMNDGKRIFKWQQQQ